MGNESIVCFQRLYVLTAVKMAVLVFGLQRRVDLQVVGRSFPYSLLSWRAIRFSAFLGFQGTSARGASHGPDVLSAVY
jgi:hypothetical protein